jgi:aspartyl-tRNA(Asn)/glutamyl-tRNA(Gln) amidotransferase subunit C
MITDQELGVLGDLAQLSLDPESRNNTLQAINEVLELVAIMNTAECDGVKPLAHPLEAVQRLRSDHVTEVDQVAKFSQIAPLFESGFYLVPKVIE